MYRWMVFRTDHMDMRECFSGQKVIGKLASDSLQSVFIWFLSAARIKCSVYLVLTLESVIAVCQHEDLSCSNDSEESHYEAEQ